MTYFGAFFECTVECRIEGGHEIGESKKEYLNPDGNRGF